MAEKVKKSDSDWQKELTSETVPDHKGKGHRKAFHRRVLEQPRKRGISLRLLRRRFIQLGDEVRFRLRLAELLGSDVGERYRRADRQQSFNVACRSPVQRMRCPSRACVRGWSGTNRPALLHKFRLAAVRKKVTG